MKSHEKSIEKWFSRVFFKEAILKIIRETYRYVRSHKLSLSIIVICKRISFISWNDKRSESNSAPDPPHRQVMNTSLLGSISFLL